MDKGWPLCDGVGPGEVILVDKIALEILLQQKSGRTSPTVCISEGLCSLEMTKALLCYLRSGSSLTTQESCLNYTLLHDGQYVLTIQTKDETLIFVGS